MTVHNSALQCKTVWSVSLYIEAYHRNKHWNVSRCGVATSVAVQPNPSVWCPMPGCHWSPSCSFAEDQVENQEQLLHDGTTNGWEMLWYWTRFFGGKILGLAIAQVMVLVLLGCGTPLGIAATLPGQSGSARTLPRKQVDPPGRPADEWMVAIRKWFQPPARRKHKLYWVITGGSDTGKFLVMVHNLACLWW